jgi:hypothetical protein
MTKTKSISDIRKSRPRGRPSIGGEGVPILVRLRPDLEQRLEGWIERQDDAPSRPEAIRRLVERGLGAPKGKR